MPTSRNELPCVSVLMPLYNAEKTLDEALESVLSQSLREIELIAVDDGSQDGSADILRDWTQRDARVRPVFAEHAGIVEAPNRGWICVEGNLLRAWMPMIACIGIGCRNRLSALERIRL